MGPGGDVRELPISKSMAGVNMRLKAGAVRELHWHQEAKWSYMLKGKARITAVDELGRTFADDGQIPLRVAGSCLDLQLR
jgi:oxalate decarboxylase